MVDMEANQMEVVYRGIVFESAKELAAYLGHGVSYIYRMRAKGRLNELEKGGMGYTEKLKQTVAAGGMVWSSQRECAEFFGVSSGYISAALARGTFEAWATRKLERMKAA